MIISHAHRFIFIKNRKTAGTSVEIALTRHCGRRDIITPIYKEDEEFRKDLGVRPQNFQVSAWRHAWRVRLNLAKPVTRYEFYNHITAAEIVNFIGRRKFDQYYKFCFERNPWDKVISDYFWKNNRGAYRDFDDFMERYELVSDFERYTLDGQVCVDFIGRYETLGQDLASVFHRLGLPFDGWLPNAKGGFRAKGTTYRDVIIKPEHRERIARFYAREIDLLGYEF
jgi:hypothetical protein